MLHTRKMRLRDLKRMSAFFVSVLVLNLNGIQSNEHKGDGMVKSFLRFSDFEPRASHGNYSNLSKTLTRQSIHLKRIGPMNSEQRQNSRSQKRTANITRQSRGFHFEASEHDLIVDMEFVVPFLKVPIERGMRLTKSMVGRLLNLHTGSLLWTGAIVVIGAIIVGIFNTLSVLGQSFYTLPTFLGYKKNSRKIDLSRSANLLDPGNKIFGDEDNFMDFGSFVEHKLLDYDVNLKACIRQSICQYFQSTAADVRSRTASTLQKILDGLINLPLLKSYLSGTALQNVIEAARKSNCDHWKRRCKWLNFLGK